MPNKFKIGDKVLIKKDNKRTPKELLEGLRLSNPRTITHIFYDKIAQHCRYYLGSNSRGRLDISDRHFRASELEIWHNKGIIGRPSTKRRYRRK